MARSTYLLHLMKPISCYSLSGHWKGSLSTHKLKGDQLSQRKFCTGITVQQTKVSRL